MDNIMGKSLNNIDSVIVKLSPDKINVGDVLASDALTSEGILLAKKGIPITERIRQLLLHNGASVLICKKKNEIHPNATNIYQDKSVSITESIKQQTLEGLQYMYENVDDDGEVVNTADSMTSSLMGCVLDAESALMNAEILKVSDDYTFKHCVDVAVMGAILGRALDLSEQNIRDITISGILHDFGKIDIDKSILNKPGKLTDNEFAIIKQHPTFGYNRLKDNKELSHNAKLGVLTHHEKFNGGGYPLNISSDKIPLIGRIMSIVDVYDALVTKRPYKDAKKPVEAYEMMLGMCNQFDLQIFNKFSQSVILYPNGTPIHLMQGVDTLVYKQNAGYPTRPVLVDVNTGKYYDLLHDRDLLSVSIETINV